MSSTRWTPELLESKVAELLGESFEESEAVPPLVESRTSAVYTPSIPPPRRPSVVHSARSSPPIPRLSREQESNLINRLYRSSSKPPAVASQPQTPSFMNAKSVALTRGLEPITLRADKLIEARQRRMEQLSAEKAEEERRSVRGYPAINEKSRIIAQRLTPDRRQEIVEQRRQLLIDQSIQREKENCVFRPNINPSIRRSAFYVTDRLVRDAESRKQRHAVLQAEREKELLAEVKPVPEISELAKSMFRDPRPSPPRPRSKSTDVVTFNDWYSGHPQTVQRIHLPKDDSSIRFPPQVTTRGHLPPPVTTRDHQSHQVTNRGHFPPQGTTRDHLSPQVTNRGHLPAPQPIGGARGTARRLDLSFIFSNDGRH